MKNQVIDEPRSDLAADPGEVDDPTDLLGHGRGLWVRRVADNVAGCVESHADNLLSEKPALLTGKMFVWASW